MVKMAHLMIVPAALLLGLSAFAQPAKADWIASWAAAPEQPHPGAGPIPATPSFQNRTVRQVLRLSAGGTSLRLRFTNTYGTKPLAVGSARVAMLDEAGREVGGSVRMLTFGGASSAVAARGAPLLSDAVALKTSALARVAVTIYLPGGTGPCTCHMMGLDEIEISPPGDFTREPFRRESITGSRPFLSAVEVDAPGKAATAVMLGDSITDGAGSPPGANRRWPDYLAERLAKRGGRAWGIANVGISGNRVLSDGAGDSALARLDRDVFALPGVKILVVFEGVNDIGIAFGETTGPLADYIRSMPNPRIDAASIIAGYRQIIDRARGHGIKVYGATIAPYKGAGYWSPAGEAVRQEVNRFIRSGAFDAVLDFDKALAAPADPLTIRDGYHMGDHLHGTDSGYKALADSIDLALFAR
jgi:lysophospholipase L1-like esterase